MSYRYSVVKPHGARTEKFWKQRYTKKKARWAQNHELEVVHLP